VDELFVASLARNVQSLISFIADRRIDVHFVMNVEQSDQVDVSPSHGAVEEFGLFVIGGAFIRLLMNAGDVRDHHNVVIIPILVSKTPDWIISPWARTGHFLCRK